MHCHSTLHIILPGLFSHPNCPPTLGCKPNLSMDVIQPTLPQPFQNRIHQIGLPAQIKKIPDSSIRLSNNSSSTTFISDAPVRNLGVTFDPHLYLSFSNHISNLSHSCFMHIRDLRRIRPMLDFKTVSTIATSIVHSKLDNCNSLFLSLDSTQRHRLQLIQNSLARAVTRTPRHHHITPVLKSLHWLKIPERIHFKVLSLTYNSLQSSQPTYLRELFTIQPTRSTR